MWYCTRPTEERISEPGGAIPEPDTCTHLECRPPDDVVELGVATTAEWHTGPMLPVEAVGNGPHELHS